MGAASFCGARRASFSHRHPSAKDTADSTARRETPLALETFLLFSSLSILFIELMINEI